MFAKNTICQKYMVPEIHPALHKENVHVLFAPVPNNIVAINILFQLINRHRQTNVATVQSRKNRVHANQVFFVNNIFYN